MVEKTNLVKGNKLRTTIISKLVANEDSFTRPNFESNIIFEM